MSSSTEAKLTVPRKMTAKQRNASRKKERELWQKENEEMRLGARAKTREEGKVHFEKAREYTREKIRLQELRGSKSLAARRAHNAAIPAEEKLLTEKAINVLRNIAEAPNGTPDFIQDQINQGKQFLAESKKLREARKAREAAEKLEDLKIQEEEKIIQAAEVEPAGVINSYCTVM